MSGEFTVNNGENSGGLLGRVRQRELEAQITDKTGETPDEMTDEKSNLSLINDESVANNIRQELGIPTQPETEKPSLQEISNILLRLYDEDNVFKFNSYDVARAEYEFTQLGVDKDKLDALRKSGKTIRQLAEAVANGEVNIEDETSNKANTNEQDSNTRQELEQAFQDRRTITIIRTDTTHDSGWLIAGFTQDGKINVIKEGVGQKFITEKEFVKVDSERLTVGSQVRVMRTGKPNPESGWHIESFKRNANNDGMDVIVVSNDGNLSKEVAYSLLLEWNR